MEPFRNVGIFSESLIQKSADEGLKSYSIFWAFLVDFHSARLFFAYYGFFSALLGNFLGWGGEGDGHGSISSFCPFCVFAFWAYFGPFWVFSGHLGNPPKTIMNFPTTNIVPLVTS